MNSGRPIDGTRAAFATIILSRLAVNVQFRAILPFLPAIGRGVGVPLETVSLLVAARAVAGTASPLFGMLSDRYGRKVLMYAGLLSVAAGAGLAVLAPSFGVLILAFVVLGFARASYDPAAQAYVSDLVPYARRGRMLSLMELTWSSAWLIGVPTTGWLIGRYGWQAPFALWAILGACCLLLTWLACPVQRVVRRAATFSGPSVRQLGPGVLGALATSTLIALANANILMIYGAWMESQFNVSVALLGTLSAGISVAELLAEGTAASLVDRLGKVRSLLGGIAGASLAFLLLPLIGRTLATAILGMMILFFFAEFSIVTTLPLLSELAPAARGTVMSANSALLAAAILIMSVVSPRVWAAGGLVLNASLSAAAVIGAGLILWRIRSLAPAPAGAGT